MSYSCLPNVGAIISGHNKKILSTTTSPQNQRDKSQNCNCRGGTIVCPLKGNCQQNSVIYQASVISNGENHTYIGQAGQSFKERLNNHTKTFRNKKYENTTTLSKLIWKLKEDNRNYKIDWSIIAKAPTYHPSTQSCHLCNLEKTMIINSSDANLLNKRSELMNKCRHRKNTFCPTSPDAVLQSHGIFKKRRNLIKIRKISFQNCSISSEECC